MWESAGSRRASNSKKNKQQKSVTVVWAYEAAGETLQFSEFHQNTEKI